MLLNSHIDIFLSRSNIEFFQFVAVDNVASNHRKIICINEKEVSHCCETSFERVGPTGLEPVTP